MAYLYRIFSIFSRFMCYAVLKGCENWHVVKFKVKPQIAMTRSRFQKKYNILFYVALNFGTFVVELYRNQ